MAKLNAAKRNALPDSKFGMPGERKFPMPDASHARNAKARASQAVNAGRISKSTEEKIDSKADRVLGDKNKYDNPGHSSDNPAKRSGDGMGPLTINWR